MQHKILILILTVTLLFSMTAVNAFATSTDPVILLESAEATNGQEVSLQVLIKNNPGIWGMDLRISYDRSALTLIGVDNGDFFAESEWTQGNLNSDVYILSYEADGLNNITAESGILATLHFKVSDTAAIGDHSVTASHNAGDIININFDDINFGIVNGKINVVPKPIAVTGVTVDESLTVGIGESKAPLFSVFPADAANKSVSFKSSDTSVADVNEITGEVTGVKPGTAIITITTSDGNYTDTCTVTVACTHANKTNIAKKESDCKNAGWDAYVKCNSCGQLFAKDGMTKIDNIPFSELSDKHIGGTKTCIDRAVCNICNQPYGDLASHSFSDDIWSSDKTHHWKECKTDGCNAILDGSKTEHTPDRNSGATTEYPIKCSACGYEIEAQLLHSHVFECEVAEEAYKCTDATCTSKAVYYKSCECGQKGTETFEYGNTLEHSEGTEWKQDKDNHWKECTCGNRANTATHIDANNDGACDICQYIVNSANDNTSDNNSNNIVWIVAACAGGLGIAITFITIFFKKRSIR